MVFGFADGDQVVDVTTNDLGRVRVFDLDGVQDPDEYAQAEVQWSGSFVASELTADLAECLRKK